MKKLTIILLLLITGYLHGQRHRHVKEEWNTTARYLSESMQTGGIGWYLSPWFSAYYQTEDWWVYHCTKGWLYPESDGDKGVWLYWAETGDWVWTRDDIYPLAYNVSSGEWFNFCISEGNKKNSGYSLEI